MESVTGLLENEVAQRGSNRLGLGRHLLGGIDMKQNKGGRTRYWSSRRLTAKDVWDRIDQSGGPDACWPWKLRIIQPLGYGEAGFQGKRYLAHRLAWELANGKPVPEGHHIHHICERRDCCNPSHLEVVTPREHVINRTLNSPSAIAARKTHCKRGHEFTPENTKIYRGTRVCRQCVVINNREYGVIRRQRARERRDG